ncbi:MAG: hypothetical protein K6B43_12740 [Treponema sp.]|nr:hypothetical protein [Treponema sp.]
MALAQQMAGFTRRINQKAVECNLNREKPYLRPIPDGASSDYFYSSPKVLFILKEPYDSKSDSGRPKGGGWSIVQYHSNPSYVAENHYFTTYYVAQTANIILNGQYSQDGGKSLETYEIMSQIAYINLSKMPAYETTDEDTLRFNYVSYWREIVHAQIEFLNPDVIVCGNTFDILRSEDDFFNDYNIISKNHPYFAGDGKIESYVYNYDGNKNRLVIDAYHPSYSGYNYEYMDAMKRAFDSFRRRY